MTSTGKGEEGESKFALHIRILSVIALEHNSRWPFPRLPLFVEQSNTTQNLNKVEVWKVGRR